MTDNKMINLFHVLWYYSQHSLHFDDCTMLIIVPYFENKKSVNSIESKHRARQVVNVIDPISRFHPIKSQLLSHTIFFPQVMLMRHLSFSGNHL